MPKNKIDENSYMTKFEEQYENKNHKKTITIEPSEKIDILVNPIIENNNKEKRSYFTINYLKISTITKFKKEAKRQSMSYSKFFEYLLNKEMMD